VEKSSNDLITFIICNGEVRGLATLFFALIPKSHAFRVSRKLTRQAVE
jgi:hypothetical protein